MKAYVFEVSLYGYGDDEEEAWLDAVKAFGFNPGEPGNATMIEEINEEE